jgi:transcriptional regulator with XRE-family HTH domain
VTEGSGTESPAESTPPTLAAKLDRLFRVVRPPGLDREYTYREAAVGIAEHGGATTANYVYLLRSGRRDNPGMKLLESLASFFGVPVTYFYDTQKSEQELEEELQLRAALRDSSIRQLALRSVDLSPANLRHIIGIIERVRELERGPLGSPPPPGAWTGEEDG